MRVLAPAKLNLFLRVGRPREDGFHPLLSWMCTVALFDSLSLTPGRAGQIDLSCDRPDLPADFRNLAVRAALAVGGELAPPREGSGRAGLRIGLAKRIPAGAGLGGGSSDAARMLEATNAFWQAGLSRSKLAELAAGLGSDVPFFLHRPSAICRGRGELVAAVGRPRPEAALLILPGRHMPTPAVYRRFDEMRLGRDLEAESEPDFAEWTRLDAGRLLPRLVNDLEAPAFDIDPQLGVLRADAEQSLGRSVRMSGSGSSLFTLYDRMEAAAEAAGELGRRVSAEVMAVQLAPQVEDDLPD